MVKKSSTRKGKTSSKGKASKKDLKKKTPRKSARVKAAEKSVKSKSRKKVKSASKRVKNASTKTIERSTPKKSYELTDRDITYIVVAFVATLFQLPMVGHALIGRWKKGLVYNVGLLVSWLVVAGVYAFLLAPTFIGILCFPIFIIPVAMSFVIFYDFYKLIKKEGEFLPPVI